MVMRMRKFGAGEILKDEDVETRKTANVAWTEKDQAELEKENKETK
jgi:hypothetical protein